MYLLTVENRPGVTRNKLELLIKNLSGDWQGNPSFATNVSHPSTPLTSSTLRSPAMQGKFQLYRYLIKPYL